jgi:putative transposase
MLIQRSHLYRLEPTPEQEKFFAQTAGACRALYNLALEQRNTFWRPGRGINKKTQSKEITTLREEFEWMNAAPVHALQSAIKNLDEAFKNFFAGRAAYPRFKRKGDGDGFHLKDKAYLGFKRITLSGMGAVKLPKVGWVKLRGYRPLRGELRNVTITRRAGHWYAAVAWQKEVRDPAPSKLPPVGIDRGVKIFAALSNRVNYTAPGFFRRIETKLANAQRVLARRVKGSANWRKAKATISRLYSKAADARRDFLHQTLTTIAKNHGMVAVEALKVRNMSRSAKGTAEKPGTNVRAKSGLNRSILDQGWSMFRTMLAYKLADRGGTLIDVPPEYTSQTCPVCGVIDKASRRSQSEFVCTACGYADNADTVGAQKRSQGRTGPQGL